MTKPVAAAEGVAPLVPAPAPGKLLPADPPAPEEPATASTVPLFVYDL